MKKLAMTIGLALITTLGFSQYKKDGTPDMRYKANKQMYGGSTYSTPKRTTTKSYNSGGGHYYIQNGYQKRNGTYVAPHVKTRANNNTWDNKNPY